MKEPAAHIQKKIFTGIDLFKLIAAVLVVWLHATETSDPVAVGIQYTFTRFCVPFFFICSGYFFHSGLSRTADPNAYFRSYEKRLLMLFLVYNVMISGPIAIRDYIVNNPDVSLLRLIALVFRRVFVIGNGAYWYLVALILTCAFFYACWSRKWNGLLLFAMAAGQILQIGYSSFQGIVTSIPAWELLNRLFYTVFSWDLNFIMTGIPLFGIGWLLHQYDVVVPKAAAVMGWVLFTGLRVAEYLLPRITSNPFWAENTISIAYIPQAVMFFFMAYHCRGIPQHSCTFRQLSTFIYLSHWIVLYNVINPIMGQVGLPVYAPWFIPVKVIVTLLICLALDWLLKRTKNNIIYHLIGG